ncbi:photosynthetic NDH subunit of subcomplex B 2, chloroplastic-like [Ziziphus jujuba]|uniref:Photosynthetic NDH subunit of subcomplex B 2, chloroplastic-like n=1 Tax=Ziziphus jujuba TaxID=326968 RepID=A0ABM3ZWP3_ZIZJJ|nr:photosynthetic NDH subunit of subcomplex B 2, chloroplastic-like [Ziziphus jujuba]
MNWLSNMEKILEEGMQCPDKNMVRIFGCMLEGDARKWWKVEKTRRRHTWDQFKIAFTIEYRPPAYCEGRRREFEEIGTLLTGTRAFLAQEIDPVVCTTYCESSWSINHHHIRSRSTFYFTIPTNGSASTRTKGGIGLVINDVSEPGSKGSLLLAEWTVKDVDSDAIDALQVELSCSSGVLDLIYVVTLYPVSMATALIVKNKGRKNVTLTNAILSHFRFKRRNGAAIQGLRGCSYCSHPPLSSRFEILSPAEAMKTEDPGLFAFGYEPEKKPGLWTSQDMPFTILNNKLSRVYAAPPKERLKAFYNTPPSKYETLDQGRELFFRVIRMGFEEIYLSSPGSFSEKYGKEYFICTGPASMLVPLVVKPGEDWRGAQVIEHDNFLIQQNFWSTLGIIAFKDHICHTSTTSFDYHQNSSQ